jgi:hypothetical protein
VFKYPGYDIWRTFGTPDVAECLMHPGYDNLSTFGTPDVEPCGVWYRCVSLCMRPARRTMYFRTSAVRLSYTVLALAF